MNRTAATASGACRCRTAQGHPVWLNRDPIFERGGLNLYAFVRNGPIAYIDPFGLILEAEGDVKPAFDELLECWKEKLPEDSLLRKVITSLDDPKGDTYKVTDLKELYTNGPVPEHAAVPETYSRPAREAAALNLWKQIRQPPPTVTYIDPHPYEKDGRKWSWPEALAHELLHAYDWKTKGKGKTHKNHTDPDWIKREAEVTREARET